MGSDTAGAATGRLGEDSAKSSGFAATRSGVRSTTPTLYGSARVSKHRTAGVNPGAFAAIDEAREGVNCVNGEEDASVAVPTSFGMDRGVSKGDIARIDVGALHLGERAWKGDAACVNADALDAIDDAWEGDNGEDGEDVASAMIATPFALCEEASVEAEACVDADALRAAEDAREGGNSDNGEEGASAKREEIGERLSIATGFVSRTGWLTSTTVPSADAVLEGRAWSRGLGKEAVSSSTSSSGICLLTS